MPPPPFGYSLFLDFEWQSRSNIRRNGLYRTVGDPSTRILCCAWKVTKQLGMSVSGEVLWTPPGGALWEEQVLGHRDIELHHFQAWASRDDVRVVSHNVEVERAVLAHKFNVHVPLERLDDTAARAAAVGLPRSLEELAIALGLGEQKDADGHSVMLKLARARKPSREDRSEFWNEANKTDDFKKLYAYCLQDLRTLEEADERLPALTPTEWEVWQATLRSNEHGLKVDQGAVVLLLGIAEREQTRLGLRFHDLVGVGINSPKAAESLGMESLDKAHVRDEIERLEKALEGGNGLLALGRDYPHVERKLEALQLRQKFARASTKKLQAFIDRTSADGRVRGTLVYGGAERTLRWAGVGIQPQNFPKGSVEDMDAAFAELHRYPHAFELVQDDVLGEISGMLRGLLEGPFLVGDEAQIEARVLAWLAGQTDLLDIFARGADPYCEMATAIYKRPITKADKHERFIGKETVLGAGYGLGHKKFRDALKLKANVEITEEFAKQTIYAFRARFPAIPRLWETLGKALVYATKFQSKCITVVPGITAGSGSVAGCPYSWFTLPSGRRLYFPFAEVVDGDVEYLGRNSHKGGSWERVRTYGGKLAENVVQAIARDVLAEAMLKVEKRGLGRIALTVHDEVVVEPGHVGPPVVIDAVNAGNVPASPLTSRQLDALRVALESRPAWAPGLPLKAEVFACNRYRK